MVETKHTENQDKEARWKFFSVAAVQALQLLPRAEDVKASGK